MITVFKNRGLHSFDSNIKVVSVGISIFLLASFLLFNRLGSTYLVSFDEAFYAVIAKEIVKSGNWFAFTFGGERFFAASPVYIWLEAAWFSLFGPSELGVRIFAAVSSLLTVISLYLFFALRKNYTGGFIASIAVLSSIKFLYLSRVGNLDATLTFFTTVSLICFYIAFKKPNFFLYGCLTSGLGFLTKGPFALFPIITFFLFYIFRYKELTVNKSLLIKGILVLLVVILPWQFIEYRIYGNDFIIGFYGGYMSTKITHTAVSNRFWWIISLWQGMKLWIIIGLISTTLILTNKNNKIISRILFIFVAIAIYFLILSLIQTHNDWYLMPIYPIIAILLGQSLSQIVFVNKNPFIKYSVVLIIVLTSLVQLYRYKDQYFVPQTTDSQVGIVKETEVLSKPGSPILLDDFYFPVAIFYSSHPIIRLRANRDNMAAIPKELLNKYLGKNSLVLSNIYTVESLKKTSSYHLQTIISYGDLLLLRPAL